MADMSCGAPAGGVVPEAVNMAEQVVIEGVVCRDGVPLSGAYVRLLDGGGEFTAEVPTNESGRFRFFAAPGEWTLRALAPGAATDGSVSAVRGSVTQVALNLR
jgi:Protein of unknown function (DUF1416)